MWRKLKSWLGRFWSKPPAQYHWVRLSGTFVPCRSYLLPERFTVLMQLTSHSGYTTFLCEPLPSPDGDLIWYDDQHVRVSDQTYQLVRSPSLTQPPEPVHIQGAAYVPEEWQEHLRFTVRKP